MANLTAKAKKGTVIHRTTSETLRLGDDFLNGLNQVRVKATSTRKKSQTTSPSCSFQITGVLTRYDLEDESADDLDESHTDDISRVTDNETPSFSEDSRDTDEHPVNTQQTTCTKPVVLPPQEPQTQCKETKSSDLGRFRVVKLESVVPFSRGRWTCFDYIDESMEKSRVYESSLENSTLSKCTTNLVRHDDKKIKSEPPTPHWGPSYLHTGSIIMSEPIPIYVPLPMRTGKRTSCSVSPNVLPPVGTKGDYIRPNVHSSMSFDTIENANINDNTTSHPKTGNSEDIKTVRDLQEPENKTLARTQDNNNIEASVSCAATIDTKIEHALDVVKNHLTHAVRLEVEELKVKINELVDRISYLEYENDLLRANVAPDVLAALRNNTGK